RGFPAWCSSSARGCENPDAEEEGRELRCTNENGTAQGKPLDDVPYAGSLTRGRGHRPQRDFGHHARDEIGGRLEQAVLENFVDALSQRLFSKARQAC